MFQPRRLRTSRPFSVDTRARNPSHLTSNDQPGPAGISPGGRALESSAAASFADFSATKNSPSQSRGGGLPAGSLTFPHSLHCT